MAKVQLLDKLVAERIAAGEVVERPASVVKELVENSLDAGARHITVELEAGGMQRIRITDDGLGMNEEDATLALERFATSKIREWEDLDSLCTLGFRGEALPSVAAVSKLEILTCEEGGTGILLRVEGGVLLAKQAAAAPQGTRITVDDLFFNTPARRKFLKSPAAETSQVVDLITRLALTQPEVQFTVRSNGKESLLVSHRMVTRERLASLWKLPLDALLAFQGEVGGVRAEGFVALPQYARPTRTQQLFSINGRVIRSQSLSQALIEGFGPMLAKGKFPVALVHLTLDPSTVDVNVHPTKAEVRFADAKSPFRAIYRSIAAALESQGADTVQPGDWEWVGDHRGETAVNEGPPSPREGGGGGWGNEGPPSPREVPRSIAGGGGPAGVLALGPPEGGDGWGWGNEGPPAAPQTAPSSRPAWESHAAKPQGPGAGPRNPGAFSTSNPALARAALEMHRPLASEPSPRQAELMESAQSPDIEVLAQIYRTFIVARVGGELWIVDQHTAHERIWYEKLVNLRGPLGSSQGLLIPEVVEWTPTLAAFVEGHLETFAELGFELEPFGGSAFQLRSLPHGLKPHQGAKVLHQVVEELSAENLSVKNQTNELLREKVRAMVSCKSAVKAGDALTVGEMQSLIQEMLTVEHSLYCPHGRPTRIKLDRSALDRMFHR